jgi:lysophospholipid acyltransferase (LPLAT)-like uncharacterized protein
MAAPCPSFSFKQRAILGVFPPLIALAVRCLDRSWRVQSSIHPGSDPGVGGKPLIFALWHETVITIIGHWHGHPIQGLASQSFDGQLIVSIMRHLDYPTVSRGSSSRGGAMALMTHAQALRDGRHVAITIDGPRGPAYHSKPGILHVAKESGFSVVPTSCVATPDWRFHSWDRTQIPPPFAKVAFVLGPALSPAQLSGSTGLATLEAGMASARKNAEGILIGGTDTNSILG